MKFERPPLIRQFPTKPGILSCGPIVAIAMLVGGLRCGGAVPSTQKTSPSTLPGQAAVVAGGNWGGKNAQLQVSSSTIQGRFGCFAAQIPSPLVLNPQGQFQVQGTLQSISGPIEANNPKPIYPTQFNGTVQGNQMSLETQYTDKNGALIDETYHLSYGAHEVSTIVCALEQPPGS